MIKLRGFIFGSVVHLYWGYLQVRNCAFVDNILKVTNFKNISHSTLFASFGKHAKYIKFINDTPHTEIQIHTDTCTHRYRYHLRILHFLGHLAYMQKILILYLAHHSHMEIDTHRHMHTHTHTHIDTDTILHFALFGSFGIHVKDTNFLFGTPQTYMCTDTQTYAHT